SSSGIEGSAAAREAVHVSAQTTTTQEVVGTDNTVVSVSNSNAPTFYIYSDRAFGAAAPVVRFENWQRKSKRFEELQGEFNEYLAALRERIGVSSFAVLEARLPSMAEDIFEAF